MARDAWVVWKEKLYRVTEDGSLYEGSMCLTTDENGALIPYEEDIEGTGDAEDTENAEDA